MAHLELVKVKKVSSFRKMAIGTWKTTYDSHVYGHVDVEMDAALEYLERFRATTGLRLTVSHMMAKVMAAVMVECPELNTIMRWSRLYQRKRMGVFFQVVMHDADSGKADLSGATIYDPEQKSLSQVVVEFDDKVSKVRARKDPALEKTRSAFKKVPFFLMHRVLRFISFFQYSLNIALPGVPKDPFGSIMITNIGTMGLDVAYPPLVAYSRVPMILAMGLVRKAAVVRDDEIVVRQMMKVSATFDHRFIDGYHAAIISRVLKAWMLTPEAPEHFGPIPTSVPTSGAASPASAALPAPS